MRGSGEGERVTDEDVDAYARRAYPQLLRRAYLLTGSRAAAEDLVQESLARCVVAWRRSPVATPEAYVLRTMVNLRTSWWRRRRHAADHTLPPLADNIADGSEERAQRDVLWRLLALCPRGQRVVLVLRYYEDLSESQVAELLNVSVGTVRSQTAKGLARLRAQIERSASVEEA
ncbi:SigE family RNA polymerase sigma factor [Acidothermaceae bacterium B102]|nr:SigE family RNA polymerase sigma factor [Acidothermaceae bacterium B102]